MATQSGSKGSAGSAGIQKHDVDRLETQVRELSRSLASLATEQEFKEFILSIRRPGYTTPAEFRLVAGIVASMQAQVQVLGELKQTLFEGDREITLAER